MKNRRKPGFFMILFRSFFFRWKNYWKFTIKSGRLQAKSRAKRRIFNIFLFLISPKICLGEIFSEVHILEREFAMADETPLQVLHEPERRAQTKSYMWLFRSGEDGGPPIVLYKYLETRAGDNAVDFLHGFKGYLMCDGYSGYNKVPDAKRTACWAHIRRYLTDAIPKGKALDYTQPSVQGMLYINQLFHLEDVIRDRKSVV